MKEKDKIPSTFEDLNRKIYKDKSINHINMLPGDLKRSPDESFFKNSIVFIDPIKITGEKKKFFIPFENCFVEMVEVKDERI